MADPSDYVSENRRVQAIAAETHLRTIQSQLALAFTFCALADTELLYEEIGEAQKLLGKVRHTIERIRQHVDKAEHAPEHFVADVRNALAQLEKQIGGIESRLQCNSPSQGTLLNVRR